MTRREEITNNIGYKITKAAMEYYQTNCANDVDLSDAFEDGADWMQETMIEKACKCYCDDICDKGRCGMCFHKHDVEGQVKNFFQYKECNELKLIRKTMEE
ncbi:MAG: hypothetical protein IJD91_09935 [Clostridia bacterium]|nr:hypothetical protein [Clostridia bacterium]